MITRALVYALAAFGFLEWAGDVTCLGCNLFGELFPLVVPVVLHIVQQCDVRNSIRPLGLRHAKFLIVYTS